MRRLLVGLSILVMVAGGIVFYAANGDATEQVRTAPAGCSIARPLPPGSTMHTITSGGHTRRYLLHVPPTYQGNTAAPVVLMFHGLGGDPKTVVDATDLADRADEDGTVLVVPLGRGTPSEWKFRDPVGDPDSDLTFVRDLVRHVQRTACTDPSRLYAAGFSNGSALTLALACDGTTRFAAYAAVSGPFYEPRCDDAPPASIIYFHGTSDTTVPFGGAETVIGRLPPVNDTMSNWATRGRCPSSQASTTADDAVRHFAWRGCRGGTDVDIYAVVGGVHGWPGGGPMSPGRASQTKDSPVDATALLWSFFKRHPRTPVSAG
ncbi:alpha/beta hydrolase family esterase [Aeromicrobium wangtongii]|uniref:alpha/beta hydrolase family esterase n=1 Tax=Aeromicrobium wangtongii TaxID=2969247 RepID=UPI002016FC3D|nr:PHB depolymerase family esterase [Aeromicrobium wangtongii]MCL3817774.1 alpha/beta hydrolase-fold protein [Aeromicrobium wangtongii]